jgi:hypothetical protein
MDVHTDRTSICDEMRGLRPLQDQCRKKEKKREEKEGKGKKGKEKEKWKGRWVLI